MALELIKNQLSLLSDSLIYNKNCLKTTNDILIFGFLFGYYANSIKEHFSEVTISKIKKEYINLNDLNSFKNNSEKIIFINNEILNIKNLNISEDKTLNKNTIKLKLLQSKNFENPIVNINKIDYGINNDNVFNNKENQLNYDNPIQYPNLNYIQNINKNSTNYYNNFGNNNLEKNIINNNESHKNINNSFLDYKQNTFPNMISNNNNESKHKITDQKFIFNNDNLNIQNNYIKFDISDKNKLLNINNPNYNIYSKNKAKETYETKNKLNQIIDINKFDNEVIFINQSNINKPKYNVPNNNNNELSIFKEFQLIEKVNFPVEKVKKEEKFDDFDIKKFLNEENFKNQVIDEEVTNYIECQICTENFNFMDLQNAFLDCNCIVHGICFYSYVENEIIHNSLPIICPNQNCKKEINPAIILKVIKTNETLFKKFEKFTLGYYQKTKEDIFSCPTPDCDYVFFNDQEQNRFDCPKCKNSYCLKCNVKYHIDQTCHEYKQMNQLKNDEKEFFELAKNKQFKQCPKCKMFVEKNEGCNHMTCICKHEFCYICGKSYVNGNPDCICKKNNCVIF